MTNSWDQIRDYLQSKVSRQNYDNWFKGTSYVSTDDGTLLVSVPDSETRSLLETEYASLVQTAIDDLNLPVRRVSYGAAPVRIATNQPVVAAEAPEIESGFGTLNARFTFDTFVVG